MASDPFDADLCAIADDLMGVDADGPDGCVRAMALDVSDVEDWRIIDSSIGGQGRHTTRLDRIRFLRMPTSRMGTIAFGSVLTIGGISYKVQDFRLLDDGRETALYLVAT